MVVIQSCTLALIVFVGIQSIVSLVRNSRSSMNWIALVNLVFFGSPLVLELFTGEPKLTSHFEGVIVALDDATTAYIYYAYVAGCTLFWSAAVWRASRSSSKDTSVNIQAEIDSMRLSPLAKTVALVVVVVPCLLVFVSPDPTMYVTYTPYQRDFWRRGAARDFQSVMYQAVIFSDLAAGCLLAGASSFRHGLKWAIPFFAINAWLSGKRFPVAFAVAIVMYVIWRRRVASGRQLLYSFMIGAVLVLGYSFTYQKLWRFPSERVASRDVDDWLTEFRKDYGRDLVVRFDIYAWLHPEEYRIWNSPWEFFSQAVFAPVPRVIWKEKPYGFPHMQMKAIVPSGDADTGRLTPSWLGEAITVFGISGFLIGPVVVYLIARLGDSLTTFYSKGLCGWMVVFLMVSQFSSFTLMLYILAIVLAVENRGRKRGSVGDRVYSAPLLGMRQ